MHESSVGKEWIIWQLIDSAFPVGGFAHSGGLEAASQLGWIEDGQSVKEFVTTSLNQCSSSTVPFLMATILKPSQFLEHDQNLHAMLSSELPRKASSMQGQSLLSTACNVWEIELLTIAKSRVIHGFNCHLPIVFGLLTHFFEIEPEQSARMFLYQHARGILSAAIRLNVIGPLESQRIQFEIGLEYSKLIERAQLLSISQARQTAPVLDLLQSQQDRLYSRLFIT